MRFMGFPLCFNHFFQTFVDFLRIFFHLIFTPGYARKFSFIGSASGYDELANCDSGFPTGDRNKKRVMKVTKET